VARRTGTTCAGDARRYAELRRDYTGEQVRADSGRWLETQKPVLFARTGRPGAEDWQRLRVYREGTHRRSPDSGRHALAFAAAAGPQYKRACEAGIGTVKLHTYHLASPAGHAARWTSDDLEGARMLANQLARPRGQRGPTSDQAWQDRLPRDDHEPQALAAALTCPACPQIPSWLSPARLPPVRIARAKMKPVF
jgi:hypothetical protein